jgi:GGDEF domain-containing protein
VLAGDAMLGYIPTCLLSAVAMGGADASLYRAKKNGRDRVAA